MRRWSLNAAWRPALIVLGFASLLPALAAAAPGTPGDEAEAARRGGEAVEGEVDARPPPPPGAGKVELERLLRLPESFRTEAERRGGETAVAWRARFQQARHDLEQARLELARVDKELDSVSDSSSAWQVSAPGSDNPELSPLSFRLRQQVKDQRREIIASERRLRALEVEADLADVPPGWRE